MPHSEPQPRGSMDKAWADGRRSAFVDAQLESHERRLNAINASIEHHAVTVANLGQDVNDLSDSLSKKIDAVAKQLDTRAAVEGDRVAQLKTANDRALNSRTFILGIASVLLVLVGVLITLLQAVH